MLIRALLATLILAGPAAAQTQLEMNQQAGRGYQAADRGLNTTYNQILRRLDPAERPILRKTQRAWIAFRDAECSFQSLGVQGGSAFPMVRTACLERLTRERTRQLREVTLDCREGDLSCVFAGK